MKRILGIDYGDRSIGLAVSDPLGLTAQGLDTLRVTEKFPIDKCVEHIMELAAVYGADTIVLGYPINMNNTQGGQCRKTLMFKERLEEAMPGAGIVLADERLTTALAERTLLEGGMSRRGRSKVVDRLAAVIILQGYLDGLYSRKNNNKDGAGKHMPENGKDLNNPIKDGEDGGFDWEDSIVTIRDDNGRQIEFCVLDELTHNGNRYLLVLETDMIDDDEACAVILKETGDEGSDFVYDELSDEEFNIVAKLFDDRLEDYDIEF